jgi:hypothetical protein
MTEYLLVVALVSLMAGGVTSRVADQIRFKFGIVSAVLAGRAATLQAVSAHRRDLKTMTRANLKNIHFDD